MRYHDYHINEYRVSDRGATITFDLAYEYPENETDHSTIRFTGVALYNFEHTNNAIITDIYEVPITELINDVGANIEEWNRMLSVKDFDGSLEQYCELLVANGLAAWRIESAIGFYGFVIAKRVSNA